MLDHDLDLLRDVVRVQPHPAHDALHRRAALHLPVTQLLAVVGQLERQGVGRVVLQHVEDELFLNRLAHGVHMKRRGKGVGRRLTPGIRAGAKQLQRLVLGRGRERDKGDAALVGACGHLRGQDVLGADFAAVAQFLQFLGRQHRLELAGGLAGLRAVRLVGNDGKTLALRSRQLAHGFQGEREGLDGADDDLLAAVECFGQRRALGPVGVLDGRHHARGALKVKQRLLQLRVDDIAVRNHQHGVEHLAVLGVVQLGQEVRRPGNRVGLARTCRMLDQVLAARAVLQHRPLELARHVQLVVARKDDALDLLFLVALGDQVAAQDFQPAVNRPDLLPQVGGAVAAQRIDRVAGRALVAQVEGQKHGSCAIEPRHHRHFAVADGKVNQGAGGKRQQRLGRLALRARMAVKAVLVDGVLHALGEVGLEFDRGHGQAVEEQHQVNVVFVVQRITHLAHHAQPVGAVAGQDVGVDAERRLELGELERGFEAEQLDAVAQHVQGAALVELVAQA